MILSDQRANAASHERLSVQERDNPFMSATSPKREPPASTIGAVCITLKVNVHFISNLPTQAAGANTLSAKILFSLDLEQSEPSLDRMDLQCGKHCRNVTRLVHKDRMVCIDRCKFGKCVKG